MRLWPFGKLETRDDSYADAVVAGILARSGAQAVQTGATAAVEAVSGLVGRAFASADVVTGATLADALSPALMAQIGRALIRRGEWVALIDVDDGLVLRPAQTCDVSGGPDPASWRYTLTVAGPDRTLTYKRVPAAAVVHITYTTDPSAPWRGIGPVQAATLAGRLSAEVTAALADEASGPRGSLLPIPTDGQDDTVEGLKADIRTAGGKTLVVEGGDWGAAGGAKADWDQRRLGANPPSSMVELARHASNEVFAACGVSSDLYGDSDGAASREAYRQALHGVIAPIGRLASTELSVKLNGPVRLDWVELRAGDISGRARAFQSLVGGGMEISKAAGLAGLLIEDA